MKFSRFLLVLVSIVALVSLGCQRQPEADKAALGSKNFAASTDGVSIHYKVQGQGDIALVFVHGWCLDMSYWDMQIPSFKVYYQVVKLDLGGHGRSGINRKVWSMEAFGKDVVAVVEKLDLKKVVLIGHAMGGSVILEAARLMPERVVGLIGADTFSDIYVQRLDPEQINYFLTAFRTDFPESVRQYTLENYFRSKTQDRLKRKIIQDMAGISPEIGIGSLEELLKYDATSTLQVIDIPIRSINADRPIVTFKIVRNNADSFSLRFMSEVGHFLMMENSAGFNRMLADFLGQILLESYQH